MNLYVVQFQVSVRSKESSCHPVIYYLTNPQHLGAVKGFKRVCRQTSFFNDQSEGSTCDTTCQMAEPPDGIPCSKTRHFSGFSCCVTCDITWKFLESELRKSIQRRTIFDRMYMAHMAHPTKHVLNFK